MSFEAIEHNGTVLIVETFPGTGYPDPEPPHSELVCQVGAGPEALALARKFAAAPFMLEAARDLLAALSTVDGVLQSVPARNLFAAIAKAEGREP